MTEYESAFALIEDNPAKIKLLNIKAELFDEVVSLVKYRINNCDYTQRDVAVMLGVVQPRISDLMNGKFSKFSISMLTQFKIGLE